MSAARSQSSRSGGRAVEEGEPGKVRRALGSLYDVCVKRPAKMVGGEQVRPVVTVDRRPGCEGVEGPLQTRPQPSTAWERGGVAGRRWCRRRLGQVEQVGAFGFVELEGARDGIKNAGGHAAE